MGGGKDVHPHQGEHVGERGEQVSVGGHVGADIGERAHPQAEELAVRVQGELGIRHVVAGVLVREDGLAALARPLHGPAEPPRRPEHQAMLGVLPAFRPEAPTHVARDHADAVLGHLEDVAGERVPHAVRVLDIGVKGVALLRGVPHAQRAPRLHVLGVDARDHEAPPDYPACACHRGVRRRLIAGLEHAGDIVGALVPHCGGAGTGGVRRRRHRRQRLVVHVHQLGGVFRLGGGLRDDQGHGVADIAHPLGGEAQMGRGEHGRAVRPLALERHAHGAELVLGEIGAGEHRHHPGRCQRRLRVDAADAGVGVERAHHHHVGLAGKIDVTLIAAAALQQADVLEALDGLPDPEFAHRSVRGRS